MRKLRLVFIALLSIQVHAQESQKTNLRLKISGVEFAHSRYFGGQHQLSFLDIQNFAPNAGLSNLNLSNHNYSSYYRDNSTRGMQASVLFDLKKGDRPAFWGNPALRLGFAYQTGKYGLGSYFNSSSSFYDSLNTSYQGVTNTYAVDSVHYNEYTFGVLSNRIRLNGSFLFRTNQNKRFSIYAGLGFGFGVSINSALRQQISSGHFYQLNNVSNSYELQGILPTGQSNIDFRSYKTNSIFDLSLSMPIGFDFRLGTGDDFWKHIYLFGEVAPVLTYTKYGGSASFWNLGYSSTTGIRIKF